MFVGSHVDVYVYDVENRGASRRVFTRAESTFSTFCDVSGWGQDGILLVYRRWGQDPRYVLIDPDRGTSRMVASGGDSLSRKLVRARVYPSWYTRHVDLEAMQLLLWDPATCRETWLLDLPLAYDGYPLLHADVVLARRRVHKYLQAVHRIQGMKVSAEQDSLRVRVFTYVPRPGSASRLYRLSFAINVPEPETVRVGDLEAFGVRNRPWPVMTITRQLGPGPTEVVQALPMKAVREILEPYVAADARRRAKWFGTTVAVTLRKLPEPSDKGVIPRQYSFENESGRGRFLFPISEKRLWPPASEWRE